MTKLRWDTMQETSLEAWKEIQPHLLSIAQRAYCFIWEQGDYGATCEEIELGLGLKHQTVSARCCDLTRKFADVTPLAIVPSGVLRLTTSNYAAIVYVAKERNATTSF